MSRLWSSPWTVAVIAVLIFVITLARGGFSTPTGVKTGVALVVLLLIGFLFPPLGILIGGTALFYLAFVHGPELLAQLSGAVSQGSTTNG